MTKKILALIFCISFFGINANAQDHSKGNAGLGSGLDYGGHIGTKVTWLPAKWFGVFGSVGVYYHSTAFAAGVQLKIPSEKRLSGHFIGMYGANGGFESEIFVTRKQYYGPSIGGGLELKSKKHKNIFWNFVLFVPFRDAQLQKDVEKLESQGLKVNASTWPVNFSVGVHLMFARN